MWIRDNDGESRSNKTNKMLTHTTMNMNGRTEGGSGRGSLALLHNKHKTFWGMSTSLSFIRRLHPWGEHCILIATDSLLGSCSIDIQSHSLFLVSSHRGGHVLYDQVVYEGEGLAPVSWASYRHCSRDTTDICLEIWICQP